jgi:hypothetical protein
MERRVAAKSILSNILWDQGLSGQALQLAQEAKHAAELTDNALTLGYTLMLALVPIVFYFSGMVTAEAKLRSLQEHLAKNRPPRF